MDRYHVQCAPVDSIEVHDMDDAYLEMCQMWQVNLWGQLGTGSVLIGRTGGYC